MSNNDYGKNALEVGLACICVAIAYKIYNSKQIKGKLKDSSGREFQFKIEGDIREDIKCVR